MLADTAGRLHTKTNLMEELRKVRRVAEKGAGTVTETLLVIDATTGQNGLAQAREFREATDVTGVVLTKLDGSAKGGIVFAIETELGIPVKLVGIGEQLGDLIPFDPARVRLGAVRQGLIHNAVRREPVPGEERPTSMKRHPSRLVPLVVATVLVLGACGSDDGTADDVPPSVDDSSDDGLIAPRPIEVTGGGGGALSASAESAPTADRATSDMVAAYPYRVTTFVAGDELPALPTNDVGYVFEAGAAGEPRPGG